MTYDLIAWEGTAKLVHQRTLALQDVVREVVSSAQSCESQEDLDWIREQGEELLELSEQQQEAIQVGCRRRHRSGW